MATRKPIPIAPQTLKKAYTTYQAIREKMAAPPLRAVLGHLPNSEVTDRYYVIPQEDDLRKAVFDFPPELMKGDNDDFADGNTVATG